MSEDKDSLQWGEQQAQSLWQNLYASWDPLIDGRVVLDLGCSWGYLLRLLGTRFAPKALVGVDLTPRWKQAPDGWRDGIDAPMQLHAGHLHELAEIAVGSVDVILCSSVLQYMTPEELELNLARAHDLLAPGGEMLVRTRCATSYIGGDLHSFFDLPYAHLLHAEADVAAVLADAGRKPAPYLNWLSSGSYLAAFVRAGLEPLDVRRRPNRAAPELAARVAARFPWADPEELACAELEARLVRPIEAEDLAAFR